MTTRIENVGIVVQDLELVRDFFVALGLEVKGVAQVHGPWVDLTLGLEDVESRICVLGSDDSDAQIELQQYVTPTPLPAARAGIPNVIGLHRVSLQVTDLEGHVGRLAQEGYGLRGEVARYADECHLCYVVGPEDLLVMLFEPISPA
ncbi:glyoxalase/bleomycin resistance protein/dioxygenase superfamily protein [Luteococcus japonicus]|uniref:Glyoxalase/bleomycin resistance protein/dioxygenase superfamily protein n=1 Tax=Luteococcus japonicus TaxID=33984 RepID=A0A3N1ZR92_9ACTN|nr:VOC family protein [Luteococcus japonicus]ROR53410.1 glyoxalase/bleomycin resistance protein/dioxygenase superfamily protein [Luteococcus japonicus]